MKTQLGNMHLLFCENINLTLLIQYWAVEKFRNAIFLGRRIQALLNLSNNFYSTYD